MDRLKVGVVFGGRSVEHDVSIVTAHQAMAVLSERHEVVPVYVSKEGDFWTGPALNDLEVYRREAWAEVGQSCLLVPGNVHGLLLGPKRKGLGVELPVLHLDFVLPAIHGTFGEDGTLQGLLDLANLPYGGSGVAASAVGMDKVAMKAAFRAADLPVVPDVLVEAENLARD